VDYQKLDADGVRAWLATDPELARVLGAEPWQIDEVSDGNMNAVFLARGKAGTLCVKQALPTVRRDENWKLPLDRAGYEVAWMRAVAPYVGPLIPRLHRYDPAQYVIAMEALSPHIIMRNGLIRGIEYPQVAAAVGRFVAAATFATSDLAVPFGTRFAQLAEFSRNEPILRISVDLVLTEPYFEHPRNRHTPGLEDVATSIRADGTLRAAAAAWGYKFLTCPQALIHGDLHSGSVMVTAHDARVIDGEFAFHGPIGFDCGAFIANLLLSYFSQPGHVTPGEDRAEYAEWVLAQIQPFWTGFHDHFLALWRRGGGGDAYQPAMFADPVGQAALEDSRQAFVAGVLADTVGFAGLEMIRRILGYAHVADFEDIADLAVRAACERPALAMARRLVAEPFADVAAIVRAARATIQTM